MATVFWRICAGFFCAATAGAQVAPPSETLLRVRNLVIAGKPEQAILIYQELVQKFPDSPVLRVDLCVTQYKARLYSDSAGTVEAALRL